MCLLQVGGGNSAVITCLMDRYKILQPVLLHLELFVRWRCVYMNIKKFINITAIKIAFKIELKILMGESMYIRMTSELIMPDFQHDEIICGLITKKRQNKAHIIL
jgi:hypothetical protein